MYFVYCKKTIIVIQTSLTIENKRCVWEMDEEGGGHYINTKNIWKTARNTNKRKYSGIINHRDGNFNKKYL